MSSAGKVKRLALLLSVGTLAGCGGLAAPGVDARALPDTPEVTPQVSGPTLPPSWTPEPTLTREATPLLRATTTPTRTPTPFATPTLSPGWTEQSDPVEGYTLRLPPTWLAPPLGGNDGPSAIAQVEQGDPMLAASLRHAIQSELLESLSFMAFDSSAASRNAPFVSTLRVGRGTTDDYETQAAQRRAALEADPAYALEADWALQVGSEAREAWLVRYTTTFPPDAPLLTTAHTQVYVDAGNDVVLVFTFSTEEAQREGYERLFELMMDTVRFSPP